MQNTQRSGHPDFYEIIDEIVALHERKNAQYATKDNPFGNFDRTSIMAGKLLNPKIENKPLAMSLLFNAKQIDGIFEMIGEAKKNTPDQVKDKLMDNIVYSIIGLMLIRREEREKANKEVKI